MCVSMVRMVDLRGYELLKTKRRWHGKYIDTKLNGIFKVNEWILVERSLTHTDSDTRRLPFCVCVCVRGCRKQPYQRISTNLM